eukprot:COSAG01_NODE_5404_length_4282_cov_4.640210_4_plen_79_part_00
MFQLGGRGADAGQAGFQLRRFAKYVRGKRFQWGHWAGETLLTNLCTSPRGRMGRLIDVHMQSRKHEVCILAADRAGRA